jgi:gliding motility-associated-like protein
MFYRLFKNGTDISQTISATSPTVDLDVICGNEYCYELETFANQIRALITPVILSYSNVSCTKAINTSTPPAVTGMQISVVEPDIWVKFTTLTPDTISVYRNSSDPFLVGNPHLRQPTNAPVFDRSASPENFSYCYSTDYKDLCGNQSPRSVSICSIRLQGSLGGSGNRNLNWNLYNGFNVLGLQTIQTLQVLNNNNQIIDSVRFINGEVTYSESQKRSQSRIIKYRIKASTLLGVPSIPYGDVYSNTISLEQPAQVAIPDAFTPNADGLNDVFRAIAPYSKEVLLEVYNRWGEVIYKSTDLNAGWDGNYSGRPAQSGAYIYYIRLVDDAGTVTEKKGTVTLLR